MKVVELIERISNDKETEIIIKDIAGNVLIDGKLDEIISQIMRNYMVEEIYKFFISIRFNSIVIRIYKEPNE